MSRRRLSIGVAVHAADKVAVAAVQFLSIPILVNAWGLEVFGVWAMMITAPTFLVLTDFGIVNAALARMTRQAAREDWAAARATFHTAWVATGILVVAVFLIGVLFVSLFGSSFLPGRESLSQREAVATVQVLLTYGLTTILFRLNATVFRATMRYSLAIAFGMGAYVFENMAVILSAQLGYGPFVASIAMLAIRLVTIVALVVISGRMIPALRPGLKFASRAAWSELWRPALAASALGFGQVGYIQGSVLALGAMAGPASVPAFVAVRTLSRLGVQVSTLVSLPFSQEFANAMGKGESRRAGRLFGVVFMVAVATAFVMAFGFWAFGKPFIDFWTHGAIYANSALIGFMAFSSAAAMLWNPLANFILAINQQRSYSYANVAVSCFGVAWIILSAKDLGAASVGMSFALVDIVTLGAVALFILRNWVPDPGFISGFQALVASVLKVQVSLGGRRN